MCAFVCGSGTCDGRPAHEVGVGEVQSGVEHKVGLHDAPGALADVVEEAGAPHRHSALVAVLQWGKKTPKRPGLHPLMPPITATNYWTSVGE